MSVINTNMKSLITQNNLTVNNRALSSAMEKLSTGKRINTAGDDAAGLAISNKMTAQIRGLNQSVRNANDGISMIQTAEGALTEVTNMLQRMRELAVQSANDTNTSSDRFALDLEYQQLGREISRIATNTQWNAMNILNNTEVGVAGTSSDVGSGVRNVKFQVGANPNQVINIGLKDFSYSVADGTIPSETSFTLGDLSGKQHFSFTIGSQRIGFSTTREIAGASMTEEELVDFETEMNRAITDTTGLQNVSTTRVGNTIFVRDAEGRPVFDGVTAGKLDSALQSFTTETLRDEFVNDETAAHGLPARGTDINGTQIAAGSQAGAVASETKFDLTTVAGTSDYFRFTMNDQNFDFTMADGDFLSTTSATELDNFVSKLLAAITGTAGYANVSVTRAGTDLYVRDPEGRSIIDSTALKGFSDSARTADTDSITGVEISQGLPPTVSTAVFSGSARLNDTQIKTQSGANQAIARLDNAMANVDHELATFGSVMNRLTFAGDNLTNVSQNTQQSRSRVLDTDYAAATTELARTQIIQQAGMAMLAQANQQPQTVLSLLQ
jgi:flagellin